MVKPDVSHLLPPFQEIAWQPDEDRIAHVRADRWIGYTQARQALAKLESLLTHPQRQRMPNLLIVGSTNNGKSMVVEKFRRGHPPVSRGASEPDQVPVLTVQMPSGPDIKRFYTLILGALGMPTYPQQNVVQKEDHTLYMLETVGVNVLVIDEVHNILAGPVTRQREFLNLLRFLGNTLKIALACVGTKDAYLAIRNDPQLENRFEPFVLPRWQDDDEYAALLASFEAVLPLRKPSHLADPALASYILTKTEGTIGELTTLLTQAAVQAITTGQECIDQPLIEAGQYHGPNERRQLFERALA